MNERIKELMLEAGKTIPGDKHIDADFCEKFAELIVKETMQVVANNLPPNTYLDVADAVIEHFGVEP